jgi:hypothetical protein
MTDEDTMNNTNDTTTADLPLAPNGHGDSNGEHPGGAAVGAAAKDTRPASKKKKKKRHAHANKPAVQPIAPVVAPVTPIETVATTEPIEPSALSERIVEVTDLLPSSVEHAAAPSEESTAAPLEAHAESLRLRMKVWTDHRTSKRYLMPTAFMRDVVNGQPISAVMYAYALRADDTQLVTLTAGEWQALPFVYVQEDGPATPNAHERAGSSP